MVIGILSDTHDRVDAARAAIAVLRDQGAQFLIHCGDVGGRGILDLLASMPSALVWGNTDYDRDQMTAYARQRGIAVYGQLASLELAGKKIAVTHGDDHRLMRESNRVRNTTTCCTATPT